MSRPADVRRRHTALLVACLSLAPALAEAAARPSLEGFWDTPAGRLEIRRKGDKVGGVLVAALPGVDIKAPALVLDGTFFEDNLTAEVRVGALVPACGASKEKAFVMLLLTRSGKLTGGVSAKAKCAKDLNALAFVRSDDQSSAGTARARVASEAAEKGDPGPFLHQGAALMQEGRFEAARKEFKKAVDVAPARGEAYNGVGVTFAMRQDYDAAIDWYKKGLEAAPGFGDLYYNLACAYSRQDKATMAVRYLKLAASKGWTDFDVMDRDPDLSVVRDTPEYAAIRSSMEEPAPPPPP